MKEVYICHQYLDKSHFLALYKCAEENGYLIKDYIVLGKKHISTEWENRYYMSTSSSRQLENAFVL